MAIHKRKLNKSLVWFSVLFSVSLVVPLVGQAAVLYFLPQSQTIYQDDTFIIEIKLDTENEEINAMEAKLKFSEDFLEFVDFSRGDSILSFWVGEPFYSREEKTIFFIGGIPNGFEGDGKLLTIVFRANYPGAAKVFFQDVSKVLLNDGKGTAAKLTFLEGNYEIIEKPKDLPIIYSRSHPDQSNWYKNKTFHLRWDLIEGAEYSFKLSRDPMFEPDEIPDKPESKEGLIWMGDMEYIDLEDGIYYFTLKQKLPERDWSGTTRFRAMIDSGPPEDFEPEIAEIEGKKYLVFAAIDKNSGVDYYEILEIKRWKSDNKIWKVGTSPYLLEDQGLRSIIKVRAVDKAGNERIAQITPSYKLTWKDAVIILLVLIGILVGWWLIPKIIQKLKKRQ